MNQQLQAGRPRVSYRISGPGQLLALVLLAGFVVVLALIVFLPADANESLQIVSRLSRIAEMLGFPYRASFTLIEFTLNIVLFVPMGVLFPLALGTVHPGVLIATVMLGVLGSVAIEWAQLMIPGRVTASSDVIANTLGVLCGVIVLGIWGAIRRSEDRRATQQRH